MNKVTHTTIIVNQIKNQQYLIGWKHNMPNSNFTLKYDYYTFCKRLKYAKPF